MRIPLPLVLVLAVACAIGCECSPSQEPSSPSPEAPTEAPTAEISDGEEQSRPPETASPEGNYRCEDREAALRKLRDIEGKLEQKTAVHADMGRIDIAGEPAERSCLQQWRELLTQLYIAAGTDDYGRLLDEALEE